GRYRGGIGVALCGSSRLWRLLACAAPQVGMPQRVTDSIIFFPFRLGVRTARASLHATRDLIQLGLATLDVVEHVLGDDPERDDHEPHVAATDAAEAAAEPTPPPS